MVSRGGRISFHLNSTLAVFVKESTVIIRLTCIFKYYSCLLFTFPTLNVISEGIFLEFQLAPSVQTKPGLCLLECLVLLCSSCVWEWLTCPSTVHREIQLSLWKRLQGFVHLIPVYFNTAFTSQELSLRPDLMSPGLMGVRV